MFSQNLIISQKKAFAIELQKLGEDITAKDKEDALVKLNIKSRTTLSSYLNGKVRSNDTAAALILFFKNRINQRNLVLIDTSFAEAKSREVHNG